MGFVRGVVDARGYAAVLRLGCGAFLPARGFCGYGLLCRPVGLLLPLPQALVSLWLPTLSCRFGVFSFLFGCLAFARYASPLCSSFGRC